MSLFPIPKNTMKRINKMRRSFIWQGTKNREATTWWNGRYSLWAENNVALAWEIFASRINACCKNGYGDFVREIEPYGENSQQKNMACLANGLLRRWRGRFNAVRGSPLRRLWPQFNNNIYTNVGNGLKTYFWNEIWKGYDSPMNLFPNLYTLSLQRFATVAQVWSQQE